jgi:hypothetical protein
MPTLTCPACGAEVGSDDLICFTCGANVPRDQPTEDDVTPPTVMQASIRRDANSAVPEAPATCPSCGLVVADRTAVTCQGCGKPLVSVTGPISAVVLRLTFPTGNVDVPAGTSLVLGRDPGESLVAAAFAPYENVSRRHATITVSDSGEATIRDDYSTNGTFVNEDRVLPGTDVHLSDGDSVRLAADVTAQVSLPGTGPDVPGYSPNGRPGVH